MTLSALTKRVKFWQQKLAPLGVGHWRVDVKIVEEPQGKPNSKAAVRSSAQYDTCWMEFAIADLAVATPDDLDETIIHEWLHVAFRDFDHAVREGIYDNFPRIAEDLWEARVDHEREGIIDRLARTILELNK